MKKLLVSLLLMLMLSAPATAAGEYVASMLRKPFHYPSCRWAKKIAPENLVTYPTRAAAISDGHVPCKVCKP